MEGAALHHDATAHIFGAGQLDDLEEGVFDHGIGKTCRNIRHRGALFLGLLHIGIHEHGAAGAQIHRMGCIEGFRGKIRGSIAQRCSKILDKRTAAGGTGLVEDHIVHHTIMEADVLHVLTADVQHAVHGRVKEAGSGGVGHCLHLTLIQREGRFQQTLAVAGGAGTHDLRRGRQLLPQRRHSRYGRLDGTAVIAGVVGKKQLSVLTDEGQLGGGGTGIDAQEAVAHIVTEPPLSQHRLLVAMIKVTVLLAAAEQGFQTLDLKIHRHTLLQPFQQVVHSGSFPRLRFQRSAQRRKQVGILRIYNMLLIQLQRTDEGLLQFRQKVQRTAQKSHAAPDRLAAGKAGNGLVHHRLKDGGRQIRPGRTLVDEGLDVRLGKYAAAGGNGIDLPIVGRLLVQTGGIRLQQRRHLVNKRTGTAGTHTVHPLFDPVGKIDDLGVLTAQLDGHIRLRRRVTHRRTGGHHLLHKGDVQRLTHADSARAGDLHLQPARPQFFSRLPQQRRQRLLGMGMVATILAKDHLPRLIQQYQFNRGGSNVHACSVSFHGISLALSQHHGRFSHMLQVYAVFLNSL